MCFGGEVEVCMHVRSCSVYRSLWPTVWHLLKLRIVKGGYLFVCSGMNGGLGVLESVSSY